jgi:uncharacterized membrane protein (DUF485 family)
VKKTVLVFGLIAGAILSVIMAATIPFADRIGFDRMLVVGYTSMVLAFLLVYFGVRSYRDDVAGGQISFGKAFQVGLGIALIACVCYVLTWLLLYYSVAHDFFDKYAAYIIEKARVGGKNDAEILKLTKEMADFKVLYQNPLINAGMTFLEPLPVGLVFTLISAALLSRKARTPAASQKA